MHMAMYHTCCDCNTLIRRCVTSATPATSIVAVMTSNSISLAIRISPLGLRGRHLLVFDLCRFIYLYVYYADFGARLLLRLLLLTASAREYSSETYANDDVLLQA